MGYSRHHKPCAASRAPAFQAPPRPAPGWEKGRNWTGSTAPKPGRRATPVVLVEDNGPIHTSKLSRAALEARAHWLRVEWLPKYAPELNDIETVWRDLKAHNLAHMTFDDVEHLNREVLSAVQDLNAQRMTVPLAKSRISA